MATLTPSCWGTTPRSTSTHGFDAAARGVEGLALRRHVAGGLPPRRSPSMCSPRLHRSGTGPGRRCGRGRRRTASARADDGETRDQQTREVSHESFDRWHALKVKKLPMAWWRSTCKKAQTDNRRAPGRVQGMRPARAVNVTPRSTPAPESCAAPGAGQSADPRCTVD